MANKGLEIRSKITVELTDDDGELLERHVFSDTHGTIGEGDDESTRFCYSVARMIESVRQTFESANLKIEYDEIIWDIIQTGFGIDLFEQLEAIEFIERIKAKITDITLNDFPINNEEED